MSVSSPAVALHRQCLICKSTSIDPMSGYDSHQLVKCRNCGFVFMHRIPSAETLTAYYDGYGQTSFLSALTTQSYNKLLDEFEAYRKHNTILDVGCGTGWFLDTALQRGWEAYGTEYSKSSVEFCESKGIKMKSGVLNPDGFGDMKFDVITSFEVMEHINTPLPELANMYKLLRPGGLLYITTPNFNAYLRYYLKDEYSIIRYPEHLSYYTRKTLHRALKQSGFKKKKMLTTGVSLMRAVKSKKATNVFVAKDSSDEKLRQVMSKNGVMVFVKNTVNNILTLTGTGLTLKAYYEKPS